jgi:hypothetical protein
MKKLFLIVSVICSFGLTAFGQSAVDLARGHLAARDFQAMKDVLDARLDERPGEEEARFLRAIARLGIFAETNVPEFLTSAGATTGEIDLKEKTFEVEFPEDYLANFVGGESFVVTGGTARLPQSVSWWDTPYYLAYGNEGDSRVSLAIQIGYEESCPDCQAEISAYLSEQDGYDFGYISIFNTPNRRESSFSRWNGSDRIVWNDLGIEGSSGVFGILTVDLEPGEWIELRSVSGEGGLPFRCRNRSKPI